MLALMNKLAIHRLKRSLRKIREDVRGLLISRFIFKEIQKIIAANPAIQVESSFYEWMGFVYATHAVVGVRRHIDRDTRSESLIQMLETIENNCVAFTKIRFQRLYPKHLRALVAVKVFKMFSGPRLDHVNPAIVRKDIRTLKKAVRRIAHFTNKRVAHLDRSRLKALPTFDQLDHALNELERLVKKYALLLLAEDSDLLPIWQYDWKQIFRSPWCLTTSVQLLRASTAANTPNNAAPST